MDECTRVSHLNAMYMALETIGELGASTIRMYCDGKSASTRDHLVSLRKNIRRVLTHARACGKLSETSRKGLDSE